MSRSIDLKSGYWGQVSDVDPDDYTIGGSSITFGGHGLSLTTIPVRQTFSCIRATLVMRFNFTKDGFMNKWLITSMIALAVSGVALAEDRQEKQKRIVVKSLGGDPEQVSEMIRKLEADPDSGHVMVTIDENGEVDVEKTAEIHMETAGLPHMMSGVPGPHLRWHHQAPAISEQAGECIIRHLDKVRVESASGLLRSACVAMNPAGDES